MAGMKTLLTLAFMGSVGMTFVIIACAKYGNWWPMIVVMFYILSALPSLLALRHRAMDGNPSQSCLDFAIFITMGFVVSSFALPIIFQRVQDKPIIETDACVYTLIGNIVMYLTFVSFFMTSEEGAQYSGW